MSRPSDVDELALEAAARAMFRDELSRHRPRGAGTCSCGARFSPQSGEFDAHLAAALVDRMAGDTARARAGL